VQFDGIVVSLPIMPTDEQQAIRLVNAANALVTE
jgi:hypothetical protein